MATVAAERDIPFAAVAQRVDDRSAAKQGVAPKAEDRGSSGCSCVS